MEQETAFEQVHAWKLIHVIQLIPSCFSHFSRIWVICWIVHFLFLKVAAKII